MSKVLMLAENPIPASQRVSRPHYLAQTLIASGYAVRTITFQPEKHEPIPGCEHIYLPFHFEQFSLFKRLSFLLAFFYVSREILRSKPDVLHGQGFLAGLAVVACSRLSRIPCVVAMPDFVETLYESFRFPFAGLASRMLVAMENLIVQNVDALIVESELARDEWSRRGGDRKRIHPIHHAADISLFDYSISGDSLRKKYGLADNLLITYHGDIGSDDGVDILIRAFGVLTKNNPSLILMIIGSGTQTTMQELKGLSPEFGNKVLFTGWVPYREIPEYIAASDIGVAPFRSTLYTNTVVPTKVLETMAMKKPAIVSNLATFGRYVSHGQHCLLVTPGSVEELTRALAALIESPALRHTLGENGRRLVEERFSWTVKTQEEVQVIAELVRPR